MSGSFFASEKGLSADRRWLHLDGVAFSLPFAWAVGRLGCTFAHDHPGRITTFFLGRSLETEAARAFITGVYAAVGRAAELPPPSSLAGMAFHDLGWYEFLYLSLVMVPVFLWLDRKERRPGFWVGAFVLLYAPVRFLLDFLRVGDARYLALTPAQWVAAGALVTGALYAAVRRTRLRAVPAGESTAARTDPIREREASR